jgi:hypothetical protein
MKQINFLALCMAALVFFSGCRKDDEDDDNNSGGNNNNSTNTNGTFVATIDGVQWQANTDMVSVVVTNFTGTPSIGVNATRMADSSFFTLTIPYFYGSDTTLTVPPAESTELRLTDDYLYIANPGTISLSRIISNGEETYTGTFNGDFEDPILGSATRVITNGAFTAKRVM